jgi:NAD+ kinase
VRIGLAAKSDDAHRVKIARYVFDYLHGRKDVDLIVQEGLSKQFNGEADVTANLGDMNVDVVIAVGGDGTMLHAMHRNDAPVFGINLGDMGFLTEAEPIELPDALDRLLNGDYYVESRLKLATRLNGEKLPDGTNETVVKTPRPSKMLHFEVALNDQPMTRLRADGIIVATPTGSTSYAMSAGGPIVDPGVEALILVPIAAFSLSSRPLVFPTTGSLNVRLLDAGKDAILVVDGQFERHVTSEDVITLTGSGQRARFVRFRPSFYQRLQERFGQP